MAKVIKVAKSRKLAKSNGKAKRNGKVAKSRNVARAYVPKPGTGFEFSDDARITILVKANPKRGASAKRFQAYLSKKPKTVAAALAAGLTRADVRWDHGKGFIRVGK